MYQIRTLPGGRGYGLFDTVNAAHGGEGGSYIGLDPTGASRAVHPNAALAFPTADAAAQYRRNRQMESPSFRTNRLHKQMVPAMGRIAKATKPAADAISQLNVALNDLSEESVVRLFATAMLHESIDHDTND